MNRNERQAKPRPSKLINAQVKHGNARIRGQLDSGRLHNGFEIGALAGAAFSRRCESFPWDADGTGHSHTHLTPPRV